MAWTVPGHAVHMVGRWWVDGNKACCHSTWVLVLWLLVRVVLQLQFQLPLLLLPPLLLLVMASVLVFRLRDPCCCCRHQVGAAGRVGCEKYS